MRAIFLLLALVLIGCGKPAVDPAFASYFTKFHEAAANRGKDVDLSGIGAKFFTPDDGDLHGDCNSSPFSKTLEVSIKWWGLMSDAQKEILMFHEFGHCALGRDHIEIGYAWDNNILTLMIPGADGMIPESEYLYRREKYLDELFRH